MVKGMDDKGVAAVLAELMAQFWRAHRAGDTASAQAFMAALAIVKTGII